MLGLGYSVTLENHRVFQACQSLGKLYEIAENIHALKRLGLNQV